MMTNHDSQGGCRKPMSGTQPSSFQEGDIVKIEVLEKRLSCGWPRLDPAHGIIGHTEHVTGEESDRFTVSDEFGAYLCSKGWVKDLGGNVEIGERRVVKAVVEPHPPAHASTSTDVGG